MEPFLEKVKAVVEGCLNLVELTVDLENVAIWFVQTVKERLEEVAGERKVQLRFIG